MIDIAETNDFKEKGGVLNQEPPSNQVENPTGQARADQARNFLKTLFGEEGKKVRANFREPRHSIWAPKCDLKEVWKELESLNSAGAKVRFAPILGNKVRDRGRSSIVPPPFFSVDIDTVISELDGAPEDFVEA